LAVHTIGGVVKPVKPLMILVPDGALTMEAKVMIKGAGFVRRGQPVQVKLEAFAFTRYGSVPGRILSISRDAAQDKDLGPYYVARIAFTSASIVTENGPAPLSPGLAATADIGIGSRRIISFLIGPMKEVAHDAGRER
jgi:hemolysin D